MKMTKILSLAAVGLCTSVLMCSCGESKEEKAKREAQAEAKAFAESISKLGPDQYWDTDKKELFNNAKKVVEKIDLNAVPSSEVVECVCILGILDLLKKFDEKGFKEWGNPKLIANAENYNHKEVVEFLMPKWYSVTKGTESEVEKLMAMIKYPGLDFYECLFRSGVRATDKMLLSVTVYGRNWDAEKLCDLLIENGAHADAADENGNTMLHKAAKGGCKPGYIYFRKQRGVQPTVNKYGKYPGQIAQEDLTKIMNDYAKKSSTMSKYQKKWTLEHICDLKMVLDAM